MPVSALAEVATCLWYIKTKHFKREWANDDPADDDPRVRRALGRLSKGIDALRKIGVEVEDPTGKRYATGSEASMRPLDFTPTEGLTYERVTEAVVPIVLWSGHAIQRAEVFVAVPPAAASGPQPPVAAQEQDVPAAGAAGQGPAEGVGSETGAAHEAPDREAAARNPEGDGPQTPPEA